MIGMLKALSLATMVMMADAAFAQDSGATSADARCAAAMSMLSKKVEGTSKAAIETGMMYYVGKIVGRVGLNALKPALEAADAALPEADVPRVATECSAELNAIGGLD